MNNENEKSGRGRPLKFNTPDELMEKGMEYIEQCRKQKKPITVTGICLHLDTNRETLMNYQVKDEFFDTIKRLKLYAENFAEENLYKRGNVVGAIFALKNFGWRDTFEVTERREPEGFSAEKRQALRDKIRSFGEKMPEEERYNLNED